MANKQLELMARFMAERGLTPSARARVPAMQAEPEHEPIDKIEIVLVSPNPDGTTTETRLERGPWNTDRSRQAEERREPAHQQIRMLDGI